MKIAVFIGGIIYDSQKKLIQGIERYAREHGIHIFIFTCGGDIYTMNDHNKGEFQIYSLPDIADYDGLIVAPDTIQNEQVVSHISELIRHTNVPAISIDAPIDGASCFYVDNASAMYQMTEHMIRQHNRRHILYISGPKENKESIARRQGFLQCIEQYGREYAITTEIEYGDYWTDSGHRIMEEHMTDLPDAVICANDFMAAGVEDVLLSHGIRIPQDVAIMGFDNSYESKFALVRITSVEKPLFKIGYEACRALHNSQTNQQDVNFPVKTIYSSSCGCKEEKKYHDSEIKKQLANEKYSNRRMAELINQMSADLNEVEHLVDFVDKFKLYVKSMNFSYFYLCLCVESEEYGLQCDGGKYQYDKIGATDYSDKINVVIAYENGMFREPSVIERRQLVPESYGEAEDSIVSVIVPIHFRQHCMGYCIVGNSSIPMETLQFESWIMNIGNSLENIHKQMIMKNMIQYLNKMWTYDTMTGVYNRAGFYQNAAQIMRVCSEQGYRLLLLFIDIDRLKSVNDTYGHEEGDFYIKMVANCCQSNCPEQGITMRYGGDEFIVLAPLIHQVWNEQIAENICTSIQKTAQEHKKKYSMSASVGHYVADVDTEFNLEQLIDQADKEMYRIKHLRGGRK